MAATPRDAAPTYGFVIPMADEGVVQLEACLGFLRDAYPAAPAVVVTDGVDDPRYAEACRRFHVAYEPGAFLKRIECGGAWWRRFLDAGARLGTDWIVKLDPDARMARPFAVAPACGIAGTLENAGTARENIQGGIQAIHRSVARKILASNLPEHGALRSEWTFDPDDATRRQWRALAYFSTDSSLMWLARQLGVVVGDWPEVASRWLAPAPANPDRKYAATHPHKLDPEPKFLGATLDVVTTVRGRLGHLRETLPLWLAEPGVRVTVVDYGCPDGTLAWVQANHPEVAVVRVEGASTFHLSRARNVGVAHLPADTDWVCFWDADWVCAPGWADAVRPRLRAGRYLLANPIRWSQFGSCVVRLADLRKAGGYDEVMTGWGAEDGDFYGRLRTVGVRPGSFPGEFFASIPHGDEARMEHYAEKDKKATQKVSDLYHHRKTRAMIALGRLTTPEEDRTMRSESLKECGLSPIVPPLEPIAARHYPAGGYAGCPAEAAPVAQAAPPPAVRADAPAPARGPMLTVSLSAGGARWDHAVDIGDFIRLGLAAPREAAPAVVASEHVAR